MSSGLLLDPMPSASTEQPNVGPRFRPYASPNHHVTKGRYITSNDPRGYIPVYEYPLNGQWIMLDMDDGYVLWTGIWKALGNNKADIVKIIDSQPDLASRLRRVRGGYLKIQGTWMPYEIALRLARRVAWTIRHDLVPLFGPNFPNTCLSPDQPGYGQIVSPGTGKRRARRTYQGDVGDSRHSWTVISPVPGSSLPIATPNAHSGQMSSRPLNQPPLYHGPASTGCLPAVQSESPVMLHVPYVERAQHPSYSATPLYSSRELDSHRGRSPSSDGGASMRYSPYPHNPLSSHEAAHRSLHSAAINLPSIQARGEDCERSGAITLPPISAMDAGRHHGFDDSIAILRRLQAEDEEPHSSAESLSHQRRHTIPDLRSDPSFGHGRVPSLTSSSPASSVSTVSPLIPTSLDRPAANDIPAAKSSLSAQLSPIWDRQSMRPPPPLLTESMRDFSERLVERHHVGAAPDDQSYNPEKRAWRPW